jgi:hypothetical protein
MSYKAIKVTQVDREQTFDLGSVHLPGSAHCDTETLCGASWTGLEYEETNDPVTCSACADVYRTIKSNQKRIRFAV